MPTNELSAKQNAWLRTNGIEAFMMTPGTRAFWKNDHWVATPKSPTSIVYLMARDESEDGDGEMVVSTFETLRDALRALSGVKGGES